MKKLKRTVACLALAAAAAWSAGPDAVRRECADAIRAVFRKASQELVERDMNRLGALIESKTAALEGAKQKRRELEARLKQMEQARDGLTRRLEDDRDVLAQIVETLRQASGTVVVGGSPYSRAAVEAEGRRYLDRCEAAEAELQQLVAAVAELAAGLKRVESTVASAEARLAGQAAAYRRLRDQDDSRRIREEIGGLAADDPAGSVEVLIEEVATLLQPLQDTSPGGEAHPQARGDRTPAVIEVEAYLTSSGMDRRPR